MAEVLVLVEHADGKVKKVTLELLTAARALGEPVAVVVGAPGSRAPLMDTLAEYGAAKVVRRPSPRTSTSYLVDPAGRGAGRAGRGRLAGGGAGRLTRPRARRSPPGWRSRLGSGHPHRRGRRRRPTALGRPSSIFGGAVEREVQGDDRHPGRHRCGPTPSRPSRPPAPPRSRSVDVTLDDAAKAAKVLERVVEAKGSRARRSPTPRSSSPAAAGSARPRTSRSSRSWPTPSAPRSARPGPRPTPAGYPHQMPGRPDRRHRLAAALRRGRHLRRDPAPGRHADLEDDRRHQQGPRGADLRAGRLRRRRRPVHRRPRS